MIFTIVLILAGGGLLYIGGNWLVSGSSSFALRRGVSKLIVGLTIVAFGTSAPELFISVVAAIEGSTSISIGNIIGSNIANIGLILGVAAIIYPPKVFSSTIRFQIPFAIFVTVLFILLTLNGNIGPIDSLILLSCFGLFTFFCLKSGREVYDGDGDQAGLLPNKLHEIVYIVFGLIGLEVGSELFVKGAIRLAETIGVSEFMIGVSIVALGTSLPELATSVIAAAKRESEIVVGNIIGSCVFNILLVMGVVGLIKPIHTPSMSIVPDMGVMLFLTILLLPMFYTGRRLSRMEGTFLLVIYAAYIVFISFRG